MRRDPGLLADSGSPMQPRRSTLSSRNQSRVTGSAAGLVAGGQPVALDAIGLQCGNDASPNIERGAAQASAAFHLRSAHEF